MGHLKILPCCPWLLRNKNSKSLFSSHHSDRSLSYMFFFVDIHCFPHSEYPSLPTQPESAHRYVRCALVKLLGHVTKEKGKVSFQDVKNTSISQYHLHLTSTHMYSPFPQNIELKSPDVEAGTTGHTSYIRHSPFAEKNWRVYLGI